jgi:hypothetical protein
LYTKLAGSLRFPPGGHYGGIYYRQKIGKNKRSGQPATRQDLATRIIGFFVSAMGMGLIFDGVTEALQTYGIPTGR